MQRAPGAAAVNAAEQMPALTETSFSRPRPDSCDCGGSATETSSLCVQP
jgi:hypothetical protein